MVVLVQPLLAHDPAGRQNQVGMISSFDIANNGVLVRFDDGQAFFDADALLVLRDAHEIHRNLADLSYETPFIELKALTQIDLFLRYGGENKQRMAMNIARSNQAIQHLCLEPFEDQLQKHISNNYGRD